jgi:protein gp37
MATKIQWTQETWNPIGGCRRKSPGCVNCYAERQAHRMAYNPNVKLALRYVNITGTNSSGIHWTGKTFIDEDVLLKPLRTKKPTTYFISLSDLFYSERPDEDIDRVFAVMALADHHRFQILTKYSERMLRYCLFRNEDLGRQAQRQLVPHMRAWLGGKIQHTGLIQWPLPNVWLGVSVENQQYADERIPLLLRTPAALRFVSYEPALGPVDFGRAYPCGYYCDESVGHVDHPFVTPGITSKIDWIIVGGESGPGARPCNVRWIRSAVRQCRESSVPVFVKQLGAFPVVEPCRQHHYDFGESIGRKARFSPVDPLHPSTELWRVHLDDRKGGAMEEWPEDVRVRQMPEVRHA